MYKTEDVIEALANELKNGIRLEQSDDTIVKNVARNQGIEELRDAILLYLSGKADPDGIRAIVENYKERK